MSNIDYQAFVREFIKLARREHNALQRAKSTFQEMVEMVKVHNMQHLFTTPANKLKGEAAKAHDALKTRTAKVYGWPEDKAANNWRQFKLRLKRELAEPGAVAAQSRKQRQRAKAKDAKAKDAKAKDAKAKDAKANDKAKRQPRQPRQPDHIAVSPSRLMQVAESVEAAMRLATSDTQKALLADALAILQEYIGFEA